MNLRKFVRAEGNLAARLPNNALAPLLAWNMTRANVEETHWDVPLEMDVPVPQDVSNGR